MKRISWIKVGIISITLLITLLAVGFFVLPAGRNDGRTEYALKAPAFVQSARADDSFIGQKLDEEAGISAYMQSTSQIDLQQVRSVFRTIEIETPDYLIGSVAVPNYAEHFDVHVYVHVDGWILAYYMQDEPVAKIIDGKNHSVAATKLDNVVAVVAGAGGVPFSGVSYYDFRYPNATHMLLVGEENEGAGNTFTIQIPSSFGYFERSYSVIGWPHKFELDGTELSYMFRGDDNEYGIITAAQLLPDVVHTVVTEDYGVLVIVYRVP